MNKVVLKRIFTYIGIGFLFLFLAYAFVPEVLGGKIVNQSDISSWKGMTNEISQHNKANPDDPTLWTNSMFGGMPSVGMYDKFEGDLTDYFYDALFIGERPASYLFICLLGGFLLMLAMGLSPILSIGGAIAIAFCSYNMQIIQVGHNTKMQAIAFMPWVLAAMIFTYKSALVFGSKIRTILPKVLLGATLFAFALSFQIKANHPQITYYLAITIFIYAITVFFSLVARKEKRNMIGKFFIASAFLLILGCMGIATNLNKLIPTYNYAEYTMRGGSELSSDDENHNKKGLDLGYATAWSYGIEETPNLLIPNFNGGASGGALGEKSETYKLLKQAQHPNLKETMKSLPLYWGPQPFTAGPMYVGAISVFLFILGLFLFKGKEKWWLLVATVFAIFLAWGNHFMWFTKLMFEYAPLYNKFRTVSMALVVLQVTIPLLAFMVLDKIIKGEYLKEDVTKISLVSYILVGGFCLIVTCFPGIAGSFNGAADSSLPKLLVDAIRADRASLLAQDAFRSFIFISLAFGAIYLYIKEKFFTGGISKYLPIFIVVLVLFDLFQVDKRYLNSDHFISKRDFGNHFAMRSVDKEILKDKSLNYRVLDLSVNTFNDAIPSYHHKCIGGYSPVKLQRYQDLIERYIHPEINMISSRLKGVATVSEAETAIGNLPINSMLNAKYIILGSSNPPLLNKSAYGNAWFVDDVLEASSPDEEIAALGKINTKTSAVIGDDFSWARDEIRAIPSSTLENSRDNIKLVHYAPNELRYSYKLASKRATIFSEIYYPNGWTAWIEAENGEKTPVNLFRANWILRGVILPSGQGELVMRFDPESYRIGERISLISSASLILLLLIISILGIIRPKFSKIQ